MVSKIDKFKSTHISQSLAESRPTGDPGLQHYLYKCVGCPCTNPSRSPNDGVTTCGEGEHHIVPGGGGGQWDRGN